jgi:hypothetical protein
MSAPRTTVWRGRRSVMVSLSWAQIGYSACAFGPGWYQLAALVHARCSGLVGVAADTRVQVGQPGVGRKPNALDEPRNGQ